MDITLQSIQLALFFQNKNQNTVIFNDSLRRIFDGNQSIETMPQDDAFDDIISLKVVSLNEEKILQGTRKRLDYFFNKQVINNAESLSLHFEEVKSDIKNIRQAIPETIGIKRIGYILNFKLVSTRKIDTSILISSGLASATKGDFDHSSVRVVNKSVFSGMDSNNVLFLTLSENKIELLCQRDFNTVAKEDYSTVLNSEKIIAFIEEVTKEINLNKISELFVK